MDVFIDVYVAIVQVDYRELLAVHWSVVEGSQHRQSWRRLRPRSNCLYLYVTMETNSRCNSRLIHHLYLFNTCTPPKRHSSDDFEL